MKYFALLDNTRIAGVYTQDTNEGIPGPSVEVPARASWPTKPDEDSQPHWIDDEIVWINPRTLEDFKISQWEAIKTERQFRDELPIAVDTFELDADAASRMDLMGAIMAMQLLSETTREWRCADNVMRTLTFTQIVSAGTGIANRRQSLIETSDILYQQIQAAETVEEVLAVAWPA